MLSAWEHATGMPHTTGLGTIKPSICIVQGLAVSCRAGRPLPLAFLGTHKVEPITPPLRVNFNALTSGGSPVATRPFATVACVGCARAGMRRAVRWRSWHADLRVQRNRWSNW
jgi:hypothetical protein